MTDVSRRAPDVTGTMLFVTVAIDKCLIRVQATVTLHRISHLVSLILVCFPFTAVGLQAESANHPNILVLCVDDLRPELNCYGVDYIHLSLIHI